MIQLYTILTQLPDNDESAVPSEGEQESNLSLDSLPSLDSLSTFKRNRKFDAFVVYHFDSDHDFVINTLIHQLEEATNLKLKIHSRDFKPGRNI